MTKIIIKKIKIVTMNGKDNVKHIEYELEPEIKKGRPAGLVLALTRIIMEKERLKEGDTLYLEDIGDKYNIILNNKIMDQAYKTEMKGTTNQ